MRLKPLLLSIAIQLLLVPPCLARDYYFSAEGSDSNTGRSPDAPLRSLSGIRRLALEPGDRILLKGGDRFEGSIRLDPSFVHGPLEIKSYGSGRAWISPPAGPGIVASNLGGLAISGLRVSGRGVNQSKADGILILTDEKTNEAFSRILLRDIDVSGFHDAGVRVDSRYGMSHFKDVRISDVVSHDNGAGGIVVGSEAYPTPHFHENVAIQNCVAHHNLGNPEDTAHQTGNGIVLGSVENGLIEHCEAYENGKLCAFNPQGGALGIWAWNSDRVTIQYNKSHDNRSGNQADGGGFDLDGSVTNSTVRYNLSYDNDGYGYELFDFYGHLTWNGPAFDHNEIHDNVSVGDGDGNGLGAIYMNGPLDNTRIYRNIVLSRSSPLVTTYPLEFEKVTGTGLRIENNFFVAGQDSPIVHMQQQGTANALVLDRNTYVQPAPFLPILSDGRKFGSWKDWVSKTGHEANGKLVQDSRPVPDVCKLETVPVLSSADFESLIEAFKKAFPR